MTFINDTKSRSDIYMELHRRICENLPKIKKTGAPEERQAAWNAAWKETKQRVLSPEELAVFNEEEAVDKALDKLKDILKAWLQTCSLEEAKRVFGGHNRVNTWTEDTLKENRRSLVDVGMYFSLAGRGWTLADAEYIESVLGGTEPTRWVTMGDTLHHCYECGREIPLESDGRVLRCATPCEHPDGIQEFATYLNVPSGVLLFANDFRGAFPLPEDDFYVNVIAEMKNYTEACGKIGLVFGFCGNTCPSVRKLGEEGTEFTIGGEDGERVGGICTDLWWYSVCDRDEFLRRTDQEGKDEAEWNSRGHIDVVPCKPGKYKVTHYGHFIDRDNGRPVYATIEWISAECDPPLPDVETEMYVHTELGHHGFSIKTEAFMSLKRAVEHMIHATDEEGGLVTREVYPNADRAARLLGPIRVEVLAVMTGGQYLQVPEGESIEAFQRKADKKRADRKALGDRLNAELTPEQWAKRKKDNESYYGKDGRANQERLRRWFARLVWRAQNGLSVYDGGMMELLFGTGFTEEMVEKWKSAEIRTREKYGAPASPEGEPPAEFYRVHVEENRLPVGD